MATSSVVGPAAVAPGRTPGRRVSRLLLRALKHNGGDPVAAARATIGVEQYPATSDFPVERGYIWTSCASVENANPLFWDDAVAAELTGGPVAPLTMLSVWFRPHAWKPGGGEGAVPLQVHFDLKALFGLPEAIMTGNTVTFYEPVRPGDRLRTYQVLRSVSDEKATRLGVGRFWVVEVFYRNQRDEPVGVETYTGYGYRRVP